MTRCTFSTRLPTSALNCCLPAPASSRRSSERRGSVTDSIYCECCGGSEMECSCEIGERFVVDRLEGGEANGPGYYVEWCETHDCATGEVSHG